MIRNDNTDSKDMDLIRQLSISNEQRDEEIERSSLLEAQLAKERASRDSIIDDEVSRRVADRMAQLEAEALHRAEETVASRRAEIAAQEEELEKREKLLEQDKAAFIRTIEEKQLQLNEEMKLAVAKIKDEETARLNQMLLDQSSVVIDLVKNDPVSLEKHIDLFKTSVGEVNNTLSKELNAKIRHTVAKRDRQATQLMRLARMLFGQKCEKWTLEEAAKHVLEPKDYAQMQLSEMDREKYLEARKVVEQYREQEQAKRILEKSKGHGRNDAAVKELPLLSRRIVNPEEYQKDKDAYIKIGENVQTFLTVVKTRYMRKEVVYPVYRLRKDPSAAPLENPVLDGLFTKSYATSEFMAEKECDRFVNHMPWYRMLREMERDGLPLAKTTLQDWHNHVCELLEPLYDLQCQRVMSSDYLAGDGSPMPVVDSEKHKTVKHYMLCFRSIDIGIPVFMISPGGKRTKEAIQAYLASWPGKAFLCDAYKGYDWIKEIAILCRCYAHARREAEVALKENKALAGKMMSLYKDIASVETAIRLAGYENDLAKVKEMRNRIALPIWAVLRRYCVIHIVDLPNSCQTYKAMNYLLNHYNELTAYINTPEMPLTNNDVEREIRQMVMGKKAYLFCENDESAHYAAIMYSFFGACKAKKIDGRLWLTYVLDHINTTSEDHLYKLLPQNWKQK